MTRRLSGIRATGRLHLGNYIGALKRWVETQDEAENFYFIADLHGLTSVSREHSADSFGHQRRSTAATFLAAGIDPHRSTFFLQSSVPQHTELMWYLAGVARKGELERMTQWKEKSRETAVGSPSAAIFVYPALMASDILLYRADEVPVGDDQRQHVEVARDWAGRFNSYFGSVFTMPSATLPAEGGRVMDLQRPSVKMSKSTVGDEGVIYLDDSNERIVRKISRAVTDTGSSVVASPEKPGITNLLEIAASLTGISVIDLSDSFRDLSYGAFKQRVTDIVIDSVAPIRHRLEEFNRDPAELDRLLGLGADRATTVAESTCSDVREALGIGLISQGSGYSMR